MKDEKELDKTTQELYNVLVLGDKKMNKLRKAVIENTLIRFEEWPDLIRKVRSASDENIIEIAAVMLSPESYINQMDKIEEILEIV